MKPTLPEMILSQVLFFGVSSACVYTAYCFYQFKNGNLRLLVIWLFASLAWAFGIEGIYWLLWDFRVVEGTQSIWIRLVKNAPFLVCILRFIQYAKLQR